ncbi:nucleotidyltransferase domain-containing protein [Streptomyces sp. NPDC046988]|uniref:nucleotidyltransferase domain-containing protein n=1 Tax=Streptomyces sp. NPDC046988 TaxID=3154922 RepID=UPI0033D35EA2
MTDEATDQLIDHFVSVVRPVLPLVSVWAHGSLAGGDYQPGRSDLDLIAVLDRPCTALEEQRLGEVHESLGSAIPFASKLHCSYPIAMELDDPARSALLPPVTDAQVADFIISDLAGFWRPSLDHPERWTRDIWVDLGLLTLARAMVTLRDGKLITKAEALDVLTEMGAPRELVDDIRQRRYGNHSRATDQWTARRADLTLTFLKPAIEQITTLPSPQRREASTGKRQPDTH